MTPTACVTLAALGSAALTFASMSSMPIGQCQKTCTSAAVSPGAIAEAADPSVVDIAVNAGSFKTLVAALEAADLVDTLQGDGPFTVFAPTDEAFAKLPAGTLEKLLKPENRDQLRAILTYHVVPGKFMAADVSTLSVAPTVNGQQVAISAKNGAVNVDSAKVVKADIRGRNGVVHVIDAVILPSSDSIVTTAANAKTFETLLAAAKAAGLVDTLSGPGPLTVFAPTDEAFKKLPAGTLDGLLKPEGRERLKAILLYHVVPGRVFAADALKAKSAKTAQGESITITTRGGKPFVNDATIVTTDIDAANGVIHVIDAVLLP